MSVSAFQVGFVDRAHLVVVALLFLYFSFLLKFDRVYLPFNQQILIVGKSIINTFY